jgi:hypothetical protein
MNKKFSGRPSNFSNLEISKNYYNYNYEVLFLFDCKFVV